MPSNPDTITIRCAHLTEEVNGVHAARKRCLALSKEYPSHWVAAHRLDTHDPTQRVVHLIEPSALVTDDDAPVAPTLADQEAMF